MGARPYEKLIAPPDQNTEYGLLDLEAACRITTFGVHRRENLPSAQYFLFLIRRNGDTIRMLTITSDANLPYPLYQQSYF